MISSTVYSIRCSNPVNARDPTGLSFHEGESAAIPKLLNKVLVIDDEVELADLASMLLSAYGLNVLTAYSAKEALRLLDSDHEIDAVVSDIVMPGMTGLQLGDVIREMYPKVKIVLVSGYTIFTEFDNREQSFLFAAKPYTIETLLKLLHT